MDKLYKYTQNFINVNYFCNHLTHPSINKELKKAGLKIQPTKRRSGGYACHRTLPDSVGKCLNQLFQFQLLPH